MSQKEESSTAKDYFAILKKYKEIYGEKTALFYQVGSFMEMYALQCPRTGLFIENPELERVSQICNLALVEKKQMLGDCRIFMSGNRDYVCEKYLNILSEAGYTSVVFTQHKEGAKFVRRLECIVSSGTHITYDTDSSSQHSNYIMCIWVERVTNSFLSGSGKMASVSAAAASTKPHFLIGLSAANIFTGKTYFFEYSTPAIISPTQFDELERQLSTFMPSETIVVSNLEKDQIHSILRFANIKCPLIHHIDLNENEKAKNCTKQKYIQHIFSTYFGDGDIVHTCAEFQTNVVATQSFCFLLDFIYEHNPNLLKNINLPSLQNTSYRMILGNQTLRQLNIIDDLGNHDCRRAGKFSSVANFLNMTSTPMGRRLFQHQLVSPTYEEEWLEEQYQIMDYMLREENFSWVEFYRAELSSKFKDLEKLNRQIAIRKIYPSSLYQLYTTIYATKNLYENIKSNTPGMIDYVSEVASIVEETDAQFLEFFETTFILDKCKVTSTMTNFEENIFQHNTGCPELDRAENNFQGATKKLNEIHKYLCGLLGGEEDTTLIKIHETDKHGFSLQITKRRAAILKTALQNPPPSAAGAEPPLSLADIKIVSAPGGGSAEEITSPEIRETVNTIIKERARMCELICRQYMNILDVIEKRFYSTVESAATFLAKIDVVLCKVFISQKYNYCRPQILHGEGETEEVEPSQIKMARGLRHVLIEHIQQNEIYVSNDVTLKSGEGMLLYGVNTTGKTSLIRSIGIALILAQTGMFVPCTEFIYKPYRAIFSRILGNDNLFHGLSTFAVEMSELRIILNMADKNTLVIGDEVCSGTENQSALSIFVAALIKLDARHCSYVFATHFHEILDYEEIQEICEKKRLYIKHMSVFYDREKDVLIYERKLQDGAGHRMYGIEICKSLHMPSEFIELAYNLRNKYYEETTGALSHKPSIYNGTKMRGMCEICGIRMSKETHHVMQQKNASSKNGYIGTIHKNHAGNLMALCEKCHDTIHSSGEKKTTTGKRIAKKSVYIGIRPLMEEEQEEAPPQAAQTRKITDFLK